MPCHLSDTGIVGCGRPYMSELGGYKWLIIPFSIFAKDKLHR